MEITVKLFEAGASLFNAIFIWWILNQMFGKKTVHAKNRSYICHIGQIVWIGMMFCNEQFMSRHFYLQIFILSVLILSYEELFLDGTFGEKALCVLTINLGMLFLNMMVMLMIAFLMGEGFAFVMEGGDALCRIMVLLITKLVCLFAGFAAVRKKKDSFLLKKEEWALVIAELALMFSVSLLVACLMVAEPEKASGTHQLMLLLIVVLLIFMTIIFYALIVRMNRQGKMELENAILTVQVNEQKEILVRTKQLYEEARQSRHDWKRYLEAFRTLLVENEEKRLLEEIQRILERDFSSVNVYYIKNKIINSVVNQKAAICEKEQIAFEVQMSGDYGLEQEMEVGIILSNLLDNAIEAERKQDNRKIMLRMFLQGAMLNMIVENNISASVLAENPKLETSKGNRSEHGIGLKSVKKMVERCGGEIGIYEEAFGFVVHICFYEGVVIHAEE